MSPIPPNPTSLAWSRKTWLVPTLMLLLGTALFVAIAADVLHQGRLVQFDRVLAPYVHEHADPMLVFLASAFSGLGEFRLLCPLALLVAAWLIYRRRWRMLATWAVGLLGSTILCGTLKTWFAIPRPGRFTLYTFDPGDGFTFPSGHTMGVVVTAGLVALLWMRHRPRPAGRRLAAGAWVGLLGVVVAGSLVYVGVHYLTDVLGGLTLATAWLGVLRWMLPPIHDLPPTRPNEESSAAPTLEDSP